MMFSDAPACWNERTIVTRMAWVGSRLFIRPSRLRWLWLSMAVIVTDQIAKYVVNSALAPYEAIPITPFARLVLVYNSGIFRGWLAFAGNEQRWPLVLMAAVMAGVLLISMVRSDSPYRMAGMALVLAGAVSNAIDRAMLSHVIDFMQVSYDGWSTAVFNIADLAIFAGIALIASSASAKDAMPRGSTAS